MIKAPKFKLGDRVRIIRWEWFGDPTEFIGKTGVITEVDPYPDASYIIGFNYDVTRDDNPDDYHYMHEEELELV
jgi:hypothetical protein